MEGRELIGRAIFFLNEASYSLPWEIKRELSGANRKKWMQIYHSSDSGPIASAEGLNHIDSYYYAEAGYLAVRDTLPDKEKKVVEKIMNTWEQYLNLIINMTDEIATEVISMFEPQMEKHQGETGLQIVERLKSNMEMFKERATLNAISVIEVVQAN